MPAEHLPVDEVLPQILMALSSHGTVVLKAEPGAGKTTRVPPAILDAGLADLPGGKLGQIVVLQPRRVAARAAATRISDERGTELGQQIGYQVRFEKRCTNATRILVCTEGIFLRRLQDDPLLENTAVVVFDEFHERSLDSDLALALARQVRQEVRPDLKIVVMSATLDSRPIADYLGESPIVECPGRVYPVDIEYLQFPSSETVERTASAGVSRMLQRTAGDILVFLPGVGEIRQTESLLEASTLADNCMLMTLYGDMPLEEQRQVLLPCEKRKIVLATNVAETSLTIDGVTAVVDSGLARINRIDARLGLNRLQVEKISRASAEQRAGRAGRTRSGACLRLWTEREHLSMREFELAEISRVELSQCILQLFLWGEKEPRLFPWFEPPPQAALEQALQLLEKLGATSDGGLTELGRRMAAVPLQPRLARLLIEGETLGCSRRAALCAALLSERDPFKRSRYPKPAEHHTDSDVLDRLTALEDFDRTGNRSSVAGELMSGPAKQILRAAEELRRSKGSSKKASPELGGLAADEALLRSILAAFPDRICKRREANGRRALMVGGRGVRLADESGVAATELFIAVELQDTGQSESLVRLASSVERDWLPQSQLNTAVEVYFDSSRDRVVASKRTRLCDIVLEEKNAAMPAGEDPGMILAEALINRSAELSALLDEDTKQYIERIQCLRAWMPELELPEFGPEPWMDILPDWCTGCSSLEELRSRSLMPYLQMRLSQKQIMAIEQEAPERIKFPNGRGAKLVYEAGKPAVLAARIQEFFGMKETPRIASSRIALLLHLLAPNYRVQQITPDLASFWKNTYEDVRKELKGRYPKHAWPLDPLVPLPERNFKRDG